MYMHVPKFHKSLHTAQAAIFLVLKHSFLCPGTFFLLFPKKVCFYLASGSAMDLFFAPSQFIGIAQVYPKMCLMCAVVHRKLIAQRSDQLKVSVKAGMQLGIGQR